MNEKYNSLELSVLTFILFNSLSSININIFNGFSLYEIILSVILSFFIGIPIIYLVIYMINNEKIKNNKLYIFIVIIYLITLIFISLVNTSNIIERVLSNDYKITIIILLIASYYLSKKGLKTIIITSNMLFIIYLLIISISFVFSIEKFNCFNLYIQSYEISKLNILSPLIYSIMPLFLLLVVPKKNIIDFNKYKRNLKKVYIISYIYLFIRLIFIVSILGISNMKYSEIYLLNNLNIINIFKSLKEFFVINYIIECYILLSLSIYFIKDLFNKNKKAN